MKDYRKDFCLRKWKEGLAIKEHKEIVTNTDFVFAGA